MKINKHEKSIGKIKIEGDRILSGDLQTTLQVTKPGPIPKAPGEIHRFLTSIRASLVCILPVSLLIIMSPIFILAPVIAIFVGVDLFYYTGAGPSGWPAVPGAVTSSNINETEKEGSYRCVWFDYTVDDVQYNSFQNFKPGPDEELKYTPGKIIQVYYNPVDAETAVIKPDCSVWSFAEDEILPDIIFLLLTVPLLIGAFRLMKWAGEKLRKTCDWFRKGGPQVVSSGFKSA